MGTKAIIRLILISMLLCAASIASGQVVLQSFAEGKIMLKKGFMLEGKDLVVTDETAEITIMGQKQVYQLSEISQVMAKQGKAKKYGKYCGASCAGFMLFSMVTNPTATKLDKNGNEVEYTPTVGDRITSLVLTGAFSYGVGYLIGRLNDEWQVVYFYNG